MKEPNVTNFTKLVLNAEEVANYLGVSRATGYRLLNSPDFPTLRIGKRMLVTREALLLWIKINTNKITNIKRE